MKKLILIAVLFWSYSCKKSAPLSKGGTGNQTPAGTTATITYKISVKHLATDWYFINTYNVYGFFTSIRDSMTVASKSYSFTAKPGSPNKYMYLLQYKYLAGSGQVYQTDSIRLQILIDGVVKRDTIVDGWTSSGGLSLYY